MPAADPNASVLTVTNDVGAVFRDFSRNYGQATRIVETGTKIISWAAVGGVGASAVAAALPYEVYVASGASEVAAAAETAATTGNEIFWFGGNKALEAAQASGGNVLRLSYAAQRALNIGRPFLARAESAWYAAHASGPVAAFAYSHAQDFSKGSIFWNNELPQLLTNPAVTSISYVFPPGGLPPFL